MNTIITSKPFCIGVSQSIKKNQVKKMSINGNSYALFRNSDGIQCIDNVCSHRGADMSQGKVINNCLQCPYHGWEFNGCGKITKVPSLTHTNTFPKKGNLKHLNIVEDGGFIWAKHDNTNEDIPTKYCSELFDPKWTKVYGEKIVDGNVRDWVLNGVDISHINYVHEFANEENGKVENVEVINKGSHVDCFANVQPKASSFLTKHMQPEVNSYIHSRFVFPNTTVIRIFLKDPYEFITYTTLCPIDEHRTLISWCLVYPKKSVLVLPFVKNRFDSEMYKTVSQDEEIIRNITPLSLPYKVNVKCDEYQVQVLKLFNMQ